MRLSGWLFCLLLCCTLSDVQAHAIGMSRGQYQVTSTGVSATLVFAHPEIAAALPTIDSDADGSISELELARQRASLEAALQDGVSLRTDHSLCAGTLSDAALTEGDGLRVRIDFACTPPAQAYSLSLPMFTLLSPGHRHLVSWPFDGVDRAYILYQAQPALSVSAAASEPVPTTGWSMLRFGIHHILTGYDHLVFLLGLLIVAPKLRELLIVITAFTLGHSVTLGLATLGVWAPSPSLIEPLIALSIVYVGIENCVTKGAIRRWPLTLGFGLIHGFGFAGVLADIELPAREVPLALITFNAGVELGQCLVLVLVLPVVRLLQRFPSFAGRGVRALSVAIALSGIGWFIERIV